MASIYSLHYQFIRCIFAIFLVSCLSCWTPFEPFTNVGKDIVTSIDPDMTDLNKEFKVLDSIDLAVLLSRSVIEIGPDTSTKRLQSGDHTDLFSAGRFGDDSSTAYVELHMYSSDLSSMRSACSSSVDDSVRLVLYYDTSNNDITLQNSNTIKVYSCARKYYPNDRNDLATIDSTLPCTTITFSRAAPDSFFIFLGANMMRQMKSAIADTNGIAKYASKIDTVTGDTTFFFDSSKKFIGAVSVHVDGGGMVNFSKKPIFQIKYRSNCSDTVWKTVGQYVTYFDICVTEAENIPPDSLVASWQADRFVEMQINLQPMWDSVKSSGGKDFKIVQNASCLLNTDMSLFDGVDKLDTTRTIIYGLLNHQITDSKTHSSDTRDSLIALMDAGRLKADSIHVAPTKLTLSMTMFLQSLIDREKPPMAYLYLFVRPPQTTSNFARVVFNKTPTIRFSALFSNSHK